MSVRPKYEGRCAPGIGGFVKKEGAAKQAWNKRQWRKKWVRKEGSW